MKSILLGFWMIALGCLVACETPTEDTSAFDQARLDSIALSQRDSLLLDQYLVDNDIDENIVTRMDDDVRYYLTDVIDTNPQPELNDLVSIHMNFRFDDNQMFQTTSKRVALTQDSLSWVNRWIDEANGGEPQTFFDDTLYVGTNPRDTVINKNKTLETTLLNLSNSKEPLDYTLFFEDVTYLPQVFNYTTSGNRLNPNWPVGLRNAMTAALPMMHLNSKLFVLCPSVMGYGSVGFGAVPSNTVVIFEVTIVNIRS